jgi:hypothetical protein
MENNIKDVVGYSIIPSQASKIKFVVRNFFKYYTIAEERGELDSSTCQYIRAVAVA